MSKSIYFLVLLFIFDLPCVAKSKSGALKDKSFFLGVSGNFVFSNTDANNVTGAIYQSKYSNLRVLNASLGVRLLNKLYLGVRYEQWLGKRQYTLNQTNQVDDLKFSNAGVDLGWITGNPRVYWILCATVFYPIQYSVLSTQSTAISYTPSKRPITYSARLILGVRFSDWLALQMEAGYRAADFGVISNGANSYINGNKSFNLSGPLLGGGLTFLF